MSKLRDWFELCRLPNVFTAMADPLAGALIVGAGWGRAGGILVLMAASACLYTAGVVLNDWHDFKADLKERPERPLPSKRVGRLQALFAAFGLLVLGGFLGCTPGPAARHVTALLIAAIVLYDIVLKEIPLAPAIMGTCRSLNLLLGMTLVPAAESPVGWSVRILFLVAMGLYVLGVSLVARTETSPHDAKQVAGGGIVAAVAVLAVVLLHILFREQAPHAEGLIWAALLMLAVGYRGTQAVLTPKAQTVQLAVKTALLGLIFFDAAMVAFTRGLPVSLFVVPLLVPAVGLGKRLYST